MAIKPTGDEQIAVYRNDPKFWDRQVYAVKKQSDQDLQCLPFCLHLSDALLYGETTLFKL